MKSYSQFKQDLWVEKMSNYKKNGFFVELGARDGIRTSNTLSLEIEYEWKGILLECAPENYQLLKQNRKNQITDNRALYNKSEETINFYRGKEKPGVGLGSIFKDQWAFRPTPVETITLSDMLKQHNAPKNIDYISMDVEGAEELALEGFLWDYNVNFWTIESGNWRDRYDLSRRERIRILMRSKGYKIYDDIDDLYTEDTSLIEDWFYLGD